MEPLVKAFHEDKIFETIRDGIVRGKYKFGEKLDIQRLAASFGVSRAPVTQAIVRLEHEGLVTIRPNVGSFVFDPTEHDVEEVMQIRTALEMCAIELAFAHLNAERLADIQKILDAVNEDSLENDPEIFFDSDRAFHDSLLIASGNNRLRSMNAALRGQIEMFRIGSFSKRAARESMRYHQGILDALKKGDIDAAKARLAEHIAVTGRCAVDILKNNRR
jgi:GntR family transcriptional regulator, rspAB operon transcriptional repressor